MRAPTSFNGFGGPQGSILLPSLLQAPTLPRSPPPFPNLWNDRINKVQPGKASWNMCNCKVLHYEIKCLHLWTNTVASMARLLAVSETAK